MTIEGRVLDLKGNELQTLQCATGESWDGFIDSRTGLKLTDSGKEGKLVGGSVEAITTMRSLNVLGDVVSSVRLERGEKTMSASFEIKPNGVTVLNGENWILSLAHRKS